MSYFSIALTTPGDAEQVYPLVRTFAPDVPPDLWAAFAASCLERGELLVLRGRDGGIFGFASYRIEDCAGIGRTMLVDNFVTLELNRSGAGRKLLVITLEQLAEQRECEEIRQIFACGGRPDEDDGMLRNHLTLANPSAGTRFSKGTHCSCGNLRSLTAAEMYPVR